MSGSGQDDAPIELIATPLHTVHAWRGPDTPCVSSGCNHAAVRSYTAVVATAEGGSAFEDRVLCLDQRTRFPGETPDELGQLSVDGGVVLLRGGRYDLPPHQAPRRQWVVPLRGAFQVMVTDGTTRRFAPGDLVLAADTSGSGHATTSIGEPPFEVLFIPVELSGR
jgi:hypothetical protein